MVGETGAADDCGFVSSGEADGSGVVDGGGAAGMPVVKLRPQDSQNWPALGAPHRGHVSPDWGDWADAVRPGAARAASEGAGLVVAGAPEMRMPQTSQ